MYLRIACSAALLAALIPYVPAQQSPTPDQTPAPSSLTRKVVILPWVLKDGTDTAVETAQSTVQKLFEGTNYEVIPQVRAKLIWEEEMKKAPIKTRPDGSDPYAEVPNAKDLLELGQKLGADVVCTGRAKWHTKSVWVGLGPKTKADCTVDVIIIDVAKQEVLLDARNVKSDSTRKEHALETFGSLFITGGITMLSGGPKTPHQQRAAQNAITKAMEPWLQTAAPKSRKIGS
jgi:hypothetical protein